MTGPAPVVSVLMTAYNRERYIAASIESVLAQRFADFELVITDNQSTDGTLAIARAYEARDPRVRVVVNERNLGQFGNRNRAATLARGRYLKYHDSDDLMYPHCLEQMVSHLEAEPRAGFALSTAWAWPGGPMPMLLSPRQCYEREYLGFGLFMCGPACGLFRADVFRALGGFDEDGVHADHLFWLRACARHSVLLLPADLFWYRTHAGQEFLSPRAAREYARLPGRVWDALASAECPLDGDDLEQARRNHAWGVAKHTWRDVRAGRLGLAVYRLRQSQMSLVDLARYVRRPRRHEMAGVPLDANGDPPSPAWVRLPPREP
ncbi:MAG: glycosyltransferase family A protein [Vicinamibacterales bacterium]|nr:glycosyltransferase family A protein [Vicinamibacterales bacterium]